MMFATAFVGVLDLTTGWFTYANAGHNPPYLVTAGEVQAIRGNAGIALGIMEDAEYDDHDLQVAQGAAIVLFTDGVTEAIDPDEAMFGEAALEASLAALGQIAAGAGRCCHPARGAGFRARRRAGGRHHGFGVTLARPPCGAGHGDDQPAFCEA